MSWNDEKTISGHLWSLFDARMLSHWLPLSPSSSAIWRTDLEDLEGLLQILDGEYILIYIYIMIWYDKIWHNAISYDVWTALDSSLLSWRSLFFVFSRAWNILPAADGTWCSWNWHNMQHGMLCQRLNKDTGIQYKDWSHDHFLFVDWSCWKCHTSSALMGFHAFYPLVN